MATTHSRDESGSVLDEVKEEGSDVDETHTQATALARRESSAALRRSLSSVESAALRKHGGAASLVGHRVCVFDSDRDTQGRVGTVMVAKPSLFRSTKNVIAFDGAAVVSNGSLLNTKPSSAHCSARCNCTC